ncbi:unnamed protein product, partial [Iphiclides podalirius]
MSQPISRTHRVASADAPGTHVVVTLVAATRRRSPQSTYTFPLREGMDARSMPPHVHGQRPPPALRFRVRPVPRAAHPAQLNIPSYRPFSRLL